jgi:hypothetical protein
MVNRTLNELKVEKHPDKTFIGRIKRGFDFLGYQFSTRGAEPGPAKHRPYQCAQARLDKHSAAAPRISDVISV